MHRGWSKARHNGRTPHEPFGWDRQSRPKAPSRIWWPALYTRALLLLLPLMMMATNTKMMLVTTIAATCCCPPPHPFLSQQAKLLRMDPEKRQRYEDKKRADEYKKAMRKRTVKM